MRIEGEGDSRRLFAPQASIVVVVAPLGPCPAELSRFLERSGVPSHHPAASSRVTQRRSGFIAQLARPKPAGKRSHVAVRSGAALLLYLEYWGAAPWL